ncbi:VCBS repeat-containing protein [Streptomyces sp. NA02950]|uniref:FG-GAP repeat domain-containing protein n=1 Tax=Streptomyces sp. NA02950 TaxID=2742137 RepID=UPI001591E7CD|nr:FG-GAP and VCBS repeat-containing protein [Streptomyces sp. NA02950]QKV93645.1 VCBS repeat-containing protein [Streptomyces sp. NA02950]
MPRHILPIGGVVAVVTGVALAATPSYAAPGTATKAPAAPTAPAVGKATPADMDGDGYDDLATGAPGAAVKGHAKAGYVALTFGSASGIKVARHQGLTQSHAGVPGTPEAGDRFGSALAMGDVDGDGHADLATVAYFDDPADEGTLGVLPGSRSGLSSTPLGRNVGLPFAGYRAVAGDVNGDGKADLAVGARGKWRGTGAVSMTYGSGGGLTGEGSILFGPDSFGYATDKAGFGSALSTPPAP